MSLRHDRSPSPGLADLTSIRMAAPAVLGHTHSQAHDHGDDDHHDHEHDLMWPEVVRIVLVALTAAAVWFRLWEPIPAVSLIGVVG
ncbi:MAG: hypothetical protein ABSH41_04305, partial [Syntrophobacteraceae bacterium]